MAKSKRVIFRLACSVCKSQNYTTSKNTENIKEKLTRKKFCKRCRKVTEHKEIKI